MPECPYFFRPRQAVMIGAILIAATVLTVPALAKGRIAVTIDAKPASKLTAEETQAVSVAAGRILKHVNDARIAIEEKKPKEALEDVEKGLTLVQIIEHAVPPIKVKAHIHSGDIAYHDEEEAHQALILIFQELDQVDVVGPTVRMKEKGTQPSTKKETGASTVTFSGVEFTSLSLDLPFAQRNLKHAQKSLRDNKLDAADLALLDIQRRGVLFELVEESLPLREAAENIKLAEYEIKDGRFLEAKAALRTASDALKDYQNATENSRSKEAKTLQKEIDDLIETIDHQKDRESMTKKMAAWWDRVTKWIKS